MYNSMVKKEKKESKYTTIVISKEILTRLSQARDLWKEENRNFSQVGLGPFIMTLIDSYENRGKNERIRQGS
jgi:hypothetical protein